MKKFKKKTRYNWKYFEDKPKGFPTELSNNSNGTIEDQRNSRKTFWWKFHKNVEGIAKTITEKNLRLFTLLAVTLAKCCHCLITKESHKLIPKSLLKTFSKQLPNNSHIQCRRNLWIRRTLTVRTLACTYIFPQYNVLVNFKISTEKWTVMRKFQRFWWKASHASQDKLPELLMRSFQVLP